MLKLRSIGIRDYSVFEGGQRIGRIRFAGERMPGVWLWNVVTLPGTDLEGVWRRCHDVGGFRSSETDLTGGLPMGSSTDLDTAKAEFGGLGSLEGRDHAFAARGSLQGVERSGRRLKDGLPQPSNIGGPPGHPGACGCG